MSSGTPYANPSDFSDRALRAHLRTRLPADCFCPCPLRALAALPLIGGIIYLSIVISHANSGWLGTLLASLLLGCFYASLFFYGHELAHGCMVRSKTLQMALLYPSFAILLLSPTLWRVWHHVVHHGHTNSPEIDPDNFGTLKRFTESRVTRWMSRFAPGSGSVLSALFLAGFFTAHAQNILWRKTGHPEFATLNITRARLETILLIAAWTYLGFSLGVRFACFGILLPMVVTNGIIMSYIVTNHLLRPLSERPNTLSTTMGVTTWRVLDYIHFNFSHHIEHHLFPGMSSRYVPRVREELINHCRSDYVCPPHLRALAMIYRTPRFYFDAHTLAEPTGPRKIPLRHLKRILNPPQNL